MRPSPRVLVILVLLAIAALGVWAFRAPTRAPASTPNEVESAALVAPNTQSLAPETIELDAQANGRSGLEATGTQARHTPLRSPLESSPGYYPPADPESMSVVRGRRDAPLVDGELQGGASSLEGMARAILAGLERRDEPAIHDLRLTREEFQTFVWPELPQSRPITHIPFEEVWGMATAQSIAGAGRTVSLYGGRHLTFLRVDYARAEPFTNFSLLRDVRILIRDPRDGAMVGLKVAPSVVERHGRYKALIFKD
jgi:hypothetical protein